MYNFNGDWEFTSKLASDGGKRPLKMDTFWPTELDTGQLEMDSFLWSMMMDVLTISIKDGIPDREQQAHRSISDFEFRMILFIIFYFLFFADLNPWMSPHLLLFLSSSFNHRYHQDGCYKEVAKGN